MKRKKKFPRFSSKSGQIAPRLLALLAVGGFCIVVGVVYFVGLKFPNFLRTQVVAPTQVEILTGDLDPSKILIGSHTLSVTGKTTDGQTVTMSQSFTIASATATPTAVPGSTPTATPTPTSAPVSGGGGGSSGGGGGGGGGGGDSSSSVASTAPGTRTVLIPSADGKKLVPLTVVEVAKALVKTAANAVTLTGPTGFSSTNTLEGTQRVVVLAQSQASATQPLTLPVKGNYLVEMTAENDVPGPVIFDIYANGKYWKRVTFDKNNNTFEKRAVGVLKGLTTNPTISYKFVNDSFKCTAAQVAAKQTEKCDRNGNVKNLILTKVK